MNNQDSEYIFSRENYGDDPFHDFQLTVIAGINTRNAFKHHQTDTYQNHNQQGNIKEFSRRGVGFKDNFVESVIDPFHF